MSEPIDQHTEEPKADFEEEVSKPEEDLSLEELNKQLETIDAKQEEDLNKVKQLAEENKEKIDAAVQLPTNPEDIEEKSVFVKGVEYGVTPQELMEYFSTCGAISRIKILTTKFGAPKGAAYIEFTDPESVKSALMFSGNMFHERELHVEPKRKNVPRFMLKRGRGRGRGSYHRGGFHPY